MRVCSCVAHMASPPPAVTHQPAVHGSRTMEQWIGACPHRESGPLRTAGDSVEQQILSCSPSWTHSIGEPYCIRTSDTIAVGVAHDFFMSAEAISHSIFGAPSVNFQITTSAHPTAHRQVLQQDERMEAKDACTGGTVGT